MVSAKIFYIVHSEVLTYRITEITLIQDISPPIFSKSHGPRDEAYRTTEERVSTESDPKDEDESDYEDESDSGSEVQSADAVSTERYFVSLFLSIFPVPCHLGPSGPSGKGVLLHVHKK